MTHSKKGDRHPLRLLAREVADRVLFMDGGSFIEEGTAAELIDNPRLERTRAFLSRLSRYQEPGAL